MKDNGPHYRRSSHVAVYWSGAKLIAQNYATRTRVVARPIVCEVLHFFDRWRGADELFTAKPHLRRRALRTLLSLLVKRSLLQRDDRVSTAAERALDTWEDWIPEAAFFHQATKDVRYGGLRAIERLTRLKERVTPMPPSVKRYPRATFAALPPVQADGPFVDTLLNRRTWRRFGTDRVELTALSTLLGLTAGVQGWLAGHSGQRVALKTSPSGGARHSIELYVLVRHVKGLRQGLYHYACDRHGLELIDARSYARQVERYLPTQTWYEGASALCFFAAVFPRVQWRYTHPRAYRAVLIEAGHLCQTFCLTATWLGLAPFCSMALADSLIERHLKLDGVTESVLYAAGVGTRPAGALWRPEETPDRRPADVTAGQFRKFPGRIDGFGQ